MGTEDVERRYGEQVDHLLERLYDAEGLARHQAEEIDGLNRRIETLVWNSEHESEVRRAATRAEEERANRLVEVLKLYAHQIPCPDCDGSRTVFTESGVEDCEWCGALGFVPGPNAWDDGKRARAAIK